MGVWIETMKNVCLDIRNGVTPCMGVWIETIRSACYTSLSTSHPVWVCGLKRVGDAVGRHAY